MAPTRPLLRAFIAAAVAAAVVLPAQALGSDDSVQFEVVPGPVGYGPVPESGTGPPGIPSDTPTPLGLSEEPKGPTSVSTRLAPYSVTDASGSGSGWSITVSGVNGRHRSPVLRQYCPSSSCGHGAGHGYVRDGLTLPANSLTLDSSGARFRGAAGRSGKLPGNSCGPVCFIDAPPRMPSKIAVATPGTGLGTFEASGFASDSVQLVRPSSPAPLPRGEIYRVDVSWSLNTGP